jgi:hypothetical protein
MRRFSIRPKWRLDWLRKQIERLSPYAALLTLVGPLAIVEPLKLITVFVAGEGHWIAGGLVMLLAYATSLFLTHWLFVIVKPKLLKLSWFERGWTTFVAIRARGRRWLIKLVRASIDRFGRADPRLP